MEQKHSKRMAFAADRLQDRLTAAQKLNIELWQAGYSRGHNDTVEGTYEQVWEEATEAAQEAIDAAIASDEKGA